MQIAIITDTHGGARQESQLFDDYFFKFYNDIFFPYLEKNNIKNILHLGDMFDRRKYVSFKILSRLRKEFIERIEDNGRTLDIVIGNHDTFYKNTSELNSPSELFGERGYKNIRYYTDPTIVSYDGLNIGLVPWINSANYDKAMDFITKAQTSILAGHFEIQDFEVIRGIKVDTGLSSSLFKHYDMVLSGHFHNKQRIGNIQYLGAPFQITFSDLNEPKGFHILDTKTRDISFVENPYKMFHKIVYDDANERPDLDTLDFSHIKDCYVRILVLSQTNDKYFKDFIEVVQKFEPFDVSFVQNMVEDDVSSDETLTTEDTLSILRREIESSELSMNKPRVQTLLGEIYTEALNLDQDTEKVS